jgi:pyruvate kinase
VARTKIVATIGPSCRSLEMLEALIEEGMDVARINCSHSEHEFIGALVTDIRELSTRLGKPVGILLDLSGPKLRTGKLAEGKVQLVKGEKFTLTSRKVPGDVHCVTTNYEPLSREVSADCSILLDDGLMELKVLSTTETDTICEIVTGGELKTHQGINIPGVRLSIPALTEKDRRDLEYGLKCEVDFVALSFVRDAQDILELRELMADHWPTPTVIAKIG